jgi:hypothetical protein
MPHQKESDPVVVGRGFVVENVRRAAIGADDCIQSAIIIQIADGQPAPDPWLLKDASRLAGDIDKPLACISYQHHRLFVMQLRIA